MKTSTDHKLFKITLRVVNPFLGERPTRYFLASLPSNPIKKDFVAALYRIGWLNIATKDAILSGDLQWNQSNDRVVTEFYHQSVGTRQRTDIKERIAISYAPMEGDV